MNIPPPPSGVTGALGNYLHMLWRTLSDLPNVSYFSGTTPNSQITGVAGDIVINVGSASSDTRAWIKSGSPSIASTLGWVTLRTGPP